jgi:SpoIIAA-like
VIEKLSRSHDSVLGFRVSGDVMRADYDVLFPATEEVVDTAGAVRMLLDLRELRWEKAEAWGADLKFGREFRHAIQRMALVGDHAWEKWMARIAEPIGYAEEIRYFTDDEEAWVWLDEPAD